MTGTPFNTGRFFYVLDLLNYLTANISNRLFSQSVILIMLRNICVTHDHGYVPLVLNISRSFLHSLLIIEFETIVTRRESLVEQELYPSEAPEFILGISRVHVVLSLVFCVVICRLLSVLLCFFFWPLCFSPSI
jgi:hypothetical protein